MSEVKLSQGTYRGGVDGDVNYYHGIPYAEPFERFQPPKAIEKDPFAAEGARDATAFGPICPQPLSRLEGIVYGPWPTPPNGGTPDERMCGVLSVYQPAAVAGSNGRKLPVIVYAHGGAWQTGSSEINWYTGTAQARDGNCVVVTINYRMGVLGFMYHTEHGSLSCGNLDHVCALEWVQKNIAAFGGDPDNVTMSGQSAGGYNTQLLVDLFPNLYRRAIIQSSPASRIVSIELAKSVADTVRSNLPEGKELQDASIEELLAAQATATKVHSSEPAQFGPIIADGVAPGGRNKVEDGLPKKDILVTWAEHDGAAFAALAKGPSTTATDDLSVKITNDLFKQPSIELAQRLRQAGHNVYSLEHQFQPEGYALGATHCIDLPLLLGDWGAWEQSPMHGKTCREEWERRGKSLRQAWGQFAKDGTMPNEIEGTLLQHLQ